MPTLEEITSHEKEINTKAKELGIKLVQLSEDRNLDNKYYLFLITTDLESGPELKKLISDFESFLCEKFEDYGISVNDIVLLKKIATLYPEDEFYKKRLEKIINISNNQSSVLRGTDDVSDVDLHRNKKASIEFIGQNNNFMSKISAGKKTTCKTR